MKATTNKTQKVTERHIINGHANLNYKYSDVCKLDEKSQIDWYWFAIVGTKANILHTDLLASTNRELIFEQIQDANFTEVSKKYLGNGSLNLNGYTTDSVAQLQTLLAYGDTTAGEKYNISCRQLQFVTECANLADLLACAKIVQTYNEYEYKNIYHATKYVKKSVFYSETNANNGNDLFKFSFGRESSPVIYIDYTFLAEGYKYIVKRSGATVEYAEYTKEMFKSDMQSFSRVCKCDEFNINEETYHDCTTLKARFWFD